MRQASRNGSPPAAAPAGNHGSPAAAEVLG
jgi:hypothetical protein